MFFKKHKNLKKIQGDITTTFDVIKAIKSDFVYNFAGISDIEINKKTKRDCKD